MRRLRSELEQPPSKLGFSQALWSGKLLARHLRDSYGVLLGPRQCRRILHTNQVGSQVHHQTERGPAPAAFFSDPVAGFNVKPMTSPSDPANKEIALRRIKRICSSGLPLYPLARALFELMGDAIPLGANRVLLADDGHHPDHYVTSPSEVAKWNPVYKHFYLDSPPQVSGVIPVPSVLQGKVVRTHEEVALPHFYRSEGYNECMRHIGFHHGLFINLRDHLGLSGAYPIWRSAEMKPFTADDVRFAQAAAPFIAHALSVAMRAASPPEHPGDFAPLEDWARG